MRFFVPEEKIQIISTDKNFFDGIIKTVFPDYFSLQIPTNQPFFKLFITNEFIEFLLVHTNVAYRCKAKILGYKISDTSQLMVVDAPEVINKIERREYKRLSTVMEVEYSCLPADINYANLKSVPPTFFRKLRKTFTIDISGGGAKIITYENKFETNSLLLSMNIGEDIKALCQVVRTEPDPKNLKHFKTALKFKDINDIHRKKIIEFVDEKLSFQPFNDPLNL